MVVLPSCSITSYTEAGFSPIHKQCEFEDIKKDINKELRILWRTEGKIYNYRNGAYKTWLSSVADGYNQVIYDVDTEPYIITVMELYNHQLNKFEFSHDIALDVLLYLKFCNSSQNQLKKIINGG